MLTGLKAPDIKYLFMLFILIGCHELVSWCSRRGNSSLQFVLWFNILKNEDHDSHVFIFKVSIIEEESSLENLVSKKKSFNGPQ